MATGWFMSRHSIADAKNHLSDLINRSLAGESIVVTRHGHPVVELKAVQPAGRRVTREDLDWLCARIVDASPTIDAGALVSRMRDEDER
jgi:prevent-host-death family protein